MPKSSRFTLSDISRLPAKAQAEVQAQLYGKPAKEIGEIIEKGKYPRLHQDRNGLNKTEAEFLAYLKHKQPLLHHTAQEITLKIANGCRYTPDFVSWEKLPIGDSIWLDAYEVKGFMRDDAAVKIKVAARQFPFIIFHLVTRKAGCWKIEEVLP